MCGSEEEKLYRVKTKDGAHINGNVREDGSRAAIQFDAENGLQGPVDLYEVNEEELVREVYIEVERKERSIKEIILEDAVAPAVEKALTVIMERAINKGVDIFSTKVIPVAKVKFNELVDKAKNTHSERKKNTQKKNQSDIIAKSSAIVERKPKSNNTKQQTVHHMQEEIDQIVNNMKFAAFYIAAGIQELSKTIVTEVEDPVKAIELETKFKELSSEQVMSTINFMLEEENKD